MIFFVYAVVINLLCVHVLLDIAPNKPFFTCTVLQLPAWCTPGIAVIFSPLISLIQDQVDSMNAIGIRYVLCCVLYCGLCIFAIFMCMFYQRW